MATNLSELYEKCPDVGWCCSKCWDRGFNDRTIQEHQLVLRCPSGRCLCMYAMEQEELKRSKGKANVSKI